MRRKWAWVVMACVAVLLSLWAQVWCQAEDTPVPQRIVSMAPNITETVFALGQGSRLVGVTDFCVYPPEAAKREKIGGFFNPNLEKLAALEPDLVLLQGRHQKVTRFCEVRGIRAVHVAMDSIATIYSGILDLGAVLGVSHKARSLCNTIKEKLEAVRERAARFPKRKVFISLGRSMGSMTSLYTVGGTSFLSEVLGIAGGENIFADVNQPYPEASKESLMVRAPDVILEMRPGDILSQEQRAELMSEWQAFHHLPAVVQGNIRIVTENFVLIPGPRVGDVAHILADALRREGPND